MIRERWKDCLSDMSVGDEVSLTLRQEEDPEALCAALIVGSSQEPPHLITNPRLGIASSAMTAESNSRSRLWKT